MPKSSRHTPCAVVFRVVITLRVMCLSLLQSSHHAPRDVRSAASQDKTPPLRGGITRSVMPTLKTSTQCVLTALNGTRSVPTTLNCPEFAEMSS